MPGGKKSALFSSDRKLTLSAKIPYLVNLPGLSALGMCWLTVVSRVLPWPSLSFGREVALWLGDFRKDFVLRKQEPLNPGGRV